MGLDILTPCVNRARCVKHRFAAVILQVLAAGNHLHLMPFNCRCIRFVRRLSHPYLP